MLTQVGRPVFTVGHSLVWINGERGRAAAPFIAPFHCGCDVSSCFKFPLSPLPNHEGLHLERGARINPSLLILFLVPVFYPSNRKQTKTNGFPLTFQILAICSLKEGFMYSGLISNLAPCCSCLTFRVLCLQCCHAVMPCSLGCLWFSIFLSLLPLTEIFCGKILKEGEPANQGS